MKKILTALACTAIFATASMADIGRVEMGLGSWSQTPSGSGSYDVGGADGIYVSDEKKSTDFYAWVLIKHPIPIVPNLRLEYVSISDEGKASGEFKDFNTGSTTTSMYYDMTQYDIIPYYNILDNTAWITLDLGLDIKSLSIDYNVSPTGLFTGYKGSDSFVIPLLYARGRVEIPSTNIGLEADMKYISYNSNTMYDYRVKVDYTFDVTPVIQPALELGYRAQKIETDNTDQANLDMDYAGLYAGIMLRF